MCFFESGFLDVLCLEFVFFSFFYVRGSRGGIEVIFSFFLFFRIRESDVRVGCLARVDRDGGLCARVTWG